MVALGDEVGCRRASEAQIVMQVSLVAHYCKKPQNLVAIVQHLQGRLSDLMGPAFRPYGIDQVHGTVIALEGCRLGRNLRNQNSGLFMNLVGLVDFLRSPRFASIRVQVGGYESSGDYPFRSRNIHPYLRSFSIQGNIAVAMGWPVQAGDFPNSLDRLRRGFQEFGVRHKWHRMDADVDNDFYFVLGKLDHGTVERTALESSTEIVRAELASYGPTDVEINRDTVRFVGYSDPQLPQQTTCWYELDEPDLAVRIEELYPNCNSVQ